MSYRILSLDGGGAWAIIEARALIGLYGIDTAGHDVLRRFHLVAENSGGSLVLAGLVENKTLGQILDLFETEANRRMIFSPTKNLPDRTLHGAGERGARVTSGPTLRRHLLEQQAAAQDSAVSWHADTRLRLACYTDW